MRVARLHGVGDLRLEDAPEPERAEGQTLVRVTAVGLCGSDLHWFGQGGIGDARLDRPVVPGHEFAGVGASGELDGVRVAVDPAIPCGECEMCREGHHNLCQRIAFAGQAGLDGGLAELIAWPTHLLHPLPAGLTGADGAMLEPLGVALHAWDLAHVRIGASVAVVGAGPIGLLLVQLARAAGAGRIVVVEPLAHRRDAAVSFGADVVMDPGDARNPAEWAAWGLGVDVSFEVAGVDDAITTAMLAARPGARVVLVGIPDDDRSSFPAALARRKGLTIVMVRRMKEMYPRTIRLVEQGLVDVRAVVSARYELADAPSAFEHAVARTGLKVVIGLD